MSPRLLTNWKGRCSSKMGIKFANVFEEIDRKINLDGMEVDRYDETAPDGRWIVMCDRCHGSGQGRFNGYDKETQKYKYDPCTECDGKSVTLQDPIAPIKPCLMHEHEWNIIYNGNEGMTVECIDPHSNLVKRAMREHPDHGWGALHGCDYMQEYMDFSLRVKLDWVNYCSNPGGWHGLERCDCGGGITIIDVLENTGAQGY